MNLSDILGGSEPCITRFVANSRSSHEPASTLHDFAVGDLDTCGSLAVKKYIDVDLSGSRNTGDVTTGGAVSGWSMTVRGPADGADPGPVVCTGTTDSTGTLVCATGDLWSLDFGTCTVTETQKTGFFNTDPGDADGVNPAPTVSRTLVVDADETTEFGNTCYVDKTFEITGVPTGTGKPTSITVAWSVTAGPGSPANGTVPLAQVGTTDVWRGAVNDTFVQTNTIGWSWYINGDSASSVTGAAGESLSGGAYPTCAKTNTTSFPFATLTGLKYKDANHDGARDTGAGTIETGLAGFDFQLKQGTTVVATATSASNGTYSFANLPPGSYTVVELAETGWLQTEPASGARSVTVSLGQTSVAIGEFGNTSLSDFGLTFTPQTAFTNSTISCTGSSTLPAASTSGSYTATDQLTGTYTCTIVIVDP